MPSAPRPDIRLPELRFPEQRVPGSRPDTEGDATLLITDRPRTRESASGPLGILRVPGAGGPTALAALAILLHRHTGQSRLLLDIGTAEGGVGALTLTVDPAESVAELLARTDRAPAREPAAGAPVRFVRAPRAGADGSYEPPEGPYELIVTRDGHDLLLGYRTALFEEDTAARLARQLMLISAFLTERPQAATGDVDLLAEGERDQVVGAFNNTGLPYPDTATVHGLFTEQAEHTPHAVAVSWRTKHLTYRQLNLLSNELAGRIVASGARPGDRVGLRTGRTPDFVIGALGILKAGCAYLSVEPDYPAERAAWLLADASVRVLVTAGDLPVDLPFDGTVLTPDSEAVDGPTRPGGTGVPVAAHDLAYVCYTSGTTGKPKGVEVVHRNVVRLVKGAGYVDLGPDVRMLPTGSTAFDANTFEMWGALLNGGSLRLVDSDVILDAHCLGRELAEHRITTLWLTSPLFNQLVEQDAALFAPLRELVVGGDALSPVHVRKVMDACPGVTLVNGYGPTENTTFSVTHRLERSDLGRIPIGRPITNSTAYVLDERGRPCPVGVPGELWLGGAGVARGYLGRPELTQERFVADPFGPEGARLYRSGDLARWRPDGVLEFFGRRDLQVKVRGFRVEPAEIETAMLAHPDVAEAVVVARSRPGRGDKYLCGYYTGPCPPDPHRLRDLLAAELPGHMVPAYLVPLPALPLNHSGKVDRARLPDPDGGHLLAGADYLAPSDETERAVVDIAERALGISGIGTAHDLRELGADSLTATLIAAGVQERLGRHCPVSAVLRAGTPARLAELLRQAAPGPARRLPLAPEQETYPLTPQQRQLYFEQVKDGRAVHYNVPLSLELPADTDPQRLARALADLAVHHETLRTRFVVEEGEVRQRIEPHVEVEVRVSEQPPYPMGEFVRPFDLGRAPLWRADVHRTPSAVILRLDLHHIVVDGFSLAPLLQDLATLYAGGAPQPASTRYRDYAVWREGPAGRALREAQEPHWQQVLAAPVDPADLPTDTARPALRELDGAVTESEIGPELTARLRQLARDEGVTLFAVLAGAYGALLASLKGTDDITVGTPVSGRTAPGLHRTVGMFANTVVLRTAATPALSFAAYLRHFADVAEAAFAHQDFPFEDLVSGAAPARDYSRTPLFDAFVALHSGRYLAVDFQGARVPVRLEQTGQAVFDLDLQVYEVAGSLRTAWRYSSGLLRPDTVDAWRREFLRLLETVAEDPSVTLGTLLPALVRTPGAPEPVLDFDF
ncbi:amino acid adenylation domain-containing protein [Streptomyces sp. NBC_00237]|uniref:amino acid adenylation domain-containing protein n=1 Tax=Streptomyces sp. NBC_00237 TaxID=2975687 RepID=UPI002253127E|nr:amino acid adenylation domain-containing protein [Streptomyces sp. NBC_00237]MCX5206205.1 amino acid adenylation domain-containing protein [Streptomyces sp. NBC_00237]